MAMEMSSSQCEMVHEQRPVMSAALFSAAMNGNGDVLIQRLGLPKEGNEVMVTIEASHSAPDKIKTEHQIVQSELQSATRFGDTVLHLLVTEWHNELALKVFQRDMSLLMAQNKKLETPLHCAAKVGNNEVIQNFIRTDLVVVKDAVQKTNETGDTALHVAVKHCHIVVILELMKLDLEATYKVNNERLSPFRIAIVKQYTYMVLTMLEVDPTLACTQFLDGMFPVHVAAQEGHKQLLLHFMEKYPDDAKLLDPRGRNIFHIAAEKNHGEFFWNAFKDTLVGEIITRIMINAMDYEGNTPADIALEKGHMSALKSISNISGSTPPEFKVVDEIEPSMENKWERTQVIGLGSVLITTLTFAAAFTIPGGYNQDHGTPVLGRRYIFRAFILANASSFILGCLSVFALILNAVPGAPVTAFKFAVLCFMLAGSSMIVAFGLGLYVTLAPVCLSIAIFLLVITLFIGSPTLFFVFFSRERYVRNVTNLFYTRRAIVPLYMVPVVVIFSLAALLYL